jgi:hypothetical protein
MDIRDETLIHLTREQIITRSALKWLLAREAKKSDDIDSVLKDASDLIGKTIAQLSMSEVEKGPLQEGLDQLIAEARLDAQK